MELRHLLLPYPCTHAARTATTLTQIRRTGGNKIVAYLQTGRCIPSWACPYEHTCIATRNGAGGMGHASSRNGNLNQSPWSFMITKTTTAQISMLLRIQT